MMKITIKKNNIIFFLFRYDKIKMLMNKYKEPYTRTK